MLRNLVGLAMVLALCTSLVGCDFGRKPGKKPTKTTEDKGTNGGDKSTKNGGDDGGTATAPVTQTVDLKVFQAAVVADKENDALTPEERDNPKPIRGGTLRVRLPTFPPGFNRHIVTQNTAGQSEINNYLNAFLLDQDPETLEYFPWVAKYWETQDVLDLLPEGDGGAEEEPGKTQYVRMYGRVKSVEEGKHVVFLKGARQVTMLRCESTVDVQTGMAKLDSGETFKAATLAKPGNLTFQIEDVSRAKETTVPWSRLAKKSWSIGKGSGLKIKYGVRRGCLHTIHLRDGVRWHDGKPFTLDDVLFTINDVIKNEHVPAANLRNYYKDLESVKKVGERTLRYEWAKPYFQSIALSGQVEVVPKHVYWKKEYEGDLKKFADDYTKHPANEAPVGNGPYKFVSWKKASILTVERNDDFFASRLGFPFWKKEQPYIDRIEFRLVKNALASLKGFQKGDIDLDKDVEPATWRNDESQKGDFIARFVRLKAETPVYTYIGWNVRKPYLQDKRVRRAMTMLIPRKQIGEDIHKGLAFPVTGPFYVRSPAYDASIKAWPYDPEAAKALLKEAKIVDRDGDGWRDYKDEKGNIKQFKFEYLIHNARQYHENIAVKVEENLKKAGIKVTIRKIDWTIFAKTVTERKFDAVRYAWGASVDPDAYQIWHSSQAPKGSNHVGYKNEEVDNIIEEARITLDGPTRWAMYRRMHRIVHDEQPYTFMFCFYTLAFYNKQFRGVRFYPTSTYGPDFTQWWLPKRFQDLRREFDK